MSKNKNLKQEQLEKVQGGIEDFNLPSDETKEQEQEERNLVQTIIDAYNKLLEGKYK